jgi:hypothetical protein
MERRVNPWEVFLKERPEVVGAYQEMMKQVNKKMFLTTR